MASLASSSPYDEASSVAAINQLVAMNPYDPQIIEQLESFVSQEASSRVYSLDANLALLRLYQFEPQRANVKVISKILIKAMMQMPKTDFPLCMYLIPEKLQAEEPISSIALLAHYLETCAFKEFWATAAKHRDLLSKYAGFEAALQSYSLRILSISYQRVPRSILAECVNIDGPSLDDFIQHHTTTSGWSVSEGSSGQVIELPMNEDNNPNVRKSQAETISLEHVARLFPILS